MREISGEAADRGELVIMAYKNPAPGQSGHVAFVGGSKLELFTYENNSDLGRFGKKREDGKQYGDGLNEESRIVLVQAGEYTGVVCINLGTNGWGYTKKFLDKNKDKAKNFPGYEKYEETKDYLLENYLHFYRIKKNVP